MAQENLNTSTPNSGLGDFIRSAFIKVQNMFTELYGNVVFKVAGKDLSKNDFTDVLKNKLDNVEAFAQVNIQSDFAQIDNTQKDFIKNKPTIPVLANYVLNGGYTGTAQDIVNLKANDNQVVHLAGIETITGAKTFSADVQIPAIPLNATSAASVSYIDNLITGITWKAATRVATTANITLSGLQTIDATVLVVGDRVLVKNQTTAVNNGIYLVSAGAWSRALDADSGTEIETATVAVTSGTVNGDTQWTCTATAVTIGTTAITFGQISGAGTYTNGSGLSLTGNVFAVTPAQPTITSLGSLTGLTISGNLTGATANFSGNVTTLGIFGGRNSNGQAFNAGNEIDSDLGIFVETNNIKFVNSFANSAFSFVTAGSTRLSLNNLAATFTVPATATSFIKTGGLSTQFLKADGSVDATVYAADNAVTKLTGDQSITDGVKTLRNTFDGYNVELSSYAVVLKEVVGTTGTKMTLNPGTLTITTPTGKDLQLSPNAGISFDTRGNAGSEGATLKSDNVTTNVTLQAPNASGTIALTLKGYTVATLPAGVQGDTAYVTNALTPTYGAVVVGGGSVVSRVFFNGTNWTTQ